MIVRMRSADHSDALLDFILEKLLESVPRVRLLRLFLQNPEEQFSIAAIIQRTRLSSPPIRKELARLVEIGIIQKKQNISFARKKGGGRKKKRAGTPKEETYRARRDFLFFKELRDLVVKSAIASRKTLTRQIKHMGGVKLAIMSGVFINNENARTDLLIVGDEVNKRRLDAFLSRTESHLGKSLSYTLMDTDEFKYRKTMYDRFLKDILEYPHEKLINRMGL